MFLLYLWSVCQVGEGNQDLGAELENVMPILTPPLKVPCCMHFQNAAKHREPQTRWGSVVDDPSIKIEAEPETTTPCRLSPLRY